MRITKFHLLSIFGYYSCHTLFPLFYWAQSTQTSVLAVFIFQVFHVHIHLFRFTHVITTEITRLISYLLENIFKLHIANLPCHNGHMLNAIFSHIS